MTTGNHQAVAADAWRKKLPQPTDRLRLGEGLRVSPFCIGCVKDARTIPAAFDRGFNFFFMTADMHWPVYERSRKGLEMLFKRRGGIREKVVVGVVSYVSKREFTYAPFIEVLRSIKGLKYIDLTIVGGAYGHDFDLLGQYRRHRAGEIPGVMATGVSFHDRAAAATALVHEMIDIAYVRYNVQHRGAERDIFPHLTKKTRKSLLYNFTSSLGVIDKARFKELGLPTGKWHPRHTDYYRWVLSKRAFDGLLVAPHTPEQVDAFVRCLDEGPLTPKAHKYMADLEALDSGRASLA